VPIFAFIAQLNLANMEQVKKRPARERVWSASRAPVEEGGARARSRDPTRDWRFTSDAC
jgi:hypothetical protein